MIYRFPDPDTLRLAMTSGLIPAEVSLAPARARHDAAGILVEPSKPLPKKHDAELRRLGVKTEKSGELDLAVESWLQILPLTTEAKPPALTSQTPVLFDLPAEQLPALVGEMLRLGNDRQAFRALANGKDTRVLLRVIGPPYYSLLRALDRDGQAAAPLAYVERQPRVWVQLGHTHPLVESIAAPPGQLLLLTPPMQWLRLPEGPFQDIYEVLEFQLPAAKSAWQGGELDRKLTVPLRLVPSGSTEPAELWVLTQRAIPQMDQLVRELDDQLVGRLAFAVGQREGGEPVVVVRVRPSKQLPPALQLDALGYRSYLKVPNLFVPVRQRLQPPLRRDAVRKLLAADAEQIVWLAPEAEGRFTPQQLPDAAFRPLADWVDYILDHDHAALDAWMQSTRFAFEPFICKDDQPPPMPKPAQSRRRGKGIKSEEAEEPPPAPAQPPGEKLRAVPAAAAMKAIPPSELQQELTALEQRFLEIDGPLDAPARQALWPRLAELNAALGHAGDAASCWLHAIWEEERLDGVNGWQAPPASLEQLLNISEPSPDDLRSLAATIIRDGADLPATQLATLRQYLEKHEGRLGVRPLWLAWLALARRAGGDPLALARARDRILDRLLAGGLSGELDLPSFLRFERGGERYRGIRDRILGLRDLAQLWILECHDGSANAACTLAYADLIFAFGLARLGEASESQRLRQIAADALARRDGIHDILLGAYSYRIDCVLRRQPHEGPLPAEFLEHLEALHINDRYKVHRLQQHSRILDPQERFDPYRHHKSQAEQVKKRIAQLPDILNGERLGQEVQQLLHAEKQLGANAELSFRLLGAVLGVVQRLGAGVVESVLARALEVLAREPKDIDAWFIENRLLPLLERGLMLAAHYDQPEAGRTFLDRFLRLFDAGEAFWSIHDFGAALYQCFRALRKFGQRDDSLQLLDRITAAVLDRDDLDEARQRLRPRWPKALAILMQVAGARLYLGQDELALAWLNEARGVFVRPDLVHQDKTPLVCAYAGALGQADAATAFPRLEDLFLNLGRLADTYTTNSHYALSQLDVIEAVVLAVVSDDFAMGQSARRWLDDDEYLVRRRIHRDVRSLMSQPEAE